VPVSSPDVEQCICVLVVSFFLLEFGTVLTVWYDLFSILSRSNMTSSDYSSDVCRDNIIKNNANDVNIFILNESQDIDRMLFKSSERHFRYTCLMKIKSRHLRR
jgi:hypothetical protein